MGNYQCAVNLGSERILSTKGSILLEGESTKEALENWTRYQVNPDAAAFFPRPSSLLHRAAAHVRGGQCAAEPALRGTRTAGTSPSHLASGRRSS